MNQFALLYNRRFFPLFITQFLGALNDNIYKNALIIFITFTIAEQQLINSTILVAMAGGIFILPYFVFSATAGQIADKYEKSLIIKRIKLAEIFIATLAAIGFISQDLVMLMTVLFFMGIQSTFFGPLKYGILPQHLEVHELTGGNGLIQMGTYFAILGGTIIGGILININTAGIFLVSVLVICVAIAGYMASRCIPKANAAENGVVIDWNIIRQTFVIIRYVISKKNIFFVIIAISWFWFIGATFLSLVPTFAKDVLIGDELVTTALLIAFSVGIGFGSLACERLSASKIEPGLVPIGAIGLTIFILDLFFIGQPAMTKIYSGQAVGIIQFFQNIVSWHILLDLTGIGFFGGIYVVPLYAIVQHRSDLHIRARVIAATNIFNAIFMVISAVLVIVLIKHSYTILQVFLIIGILNLTFTGIIFFMFPEFIERFMVISRLYLNRKIRS